MAARYDFTPTTFVLPGDYALFVEEFKKPTHAGCAWIMKPIGKSQGKGIFLFNKLSQITQWKSDYRWKPDNPGVEAYVVQRYIANPYLVGGKKFDMRLYALVTSFQPLTVYVYRSGFCRFSASRYSNDPADVVNNFVHLTNVAIQKTADNYNADTGGKWEIKRLKGFLAAKHGHQAADECFTAMQDIMLLSLQSVSKVMMSDRHCFELYGYDIMLDDTLKPWLLEVNASPSLTANTREDYDLKYKMLSDVLDIVDMEGRFSAGAAGGFAPMSTGGAGAMPAPPTASVPASDGSSSNTVAAPTAGPNPPDVPVRMGGFDLVWRGEGSIPVGGPDRQGPSVYGCLLGADFDKHPNTFPKRTATPMVPGAAGIVGSGAPSTPAGSGAVGTGALQSGSTGAVSRSAATTGVTSGSNRDHLSAAVSAVASNISSGNASKEGVSLARTQSNMAATPLANTAGNAVGIRKAAGTVPSLLQRVGSARGGSRGSVATTSSADAASVGSQQQQPSPAPRGGARPGTSHGPQPLLRAATSSQLLQIGQNTSLGTPRNR